MDWHTTDSPREQIELAQALVKVTPRLGWNQRALATASTLTFQDPLRWRSIFPAGAREAIWFISRISDASMLSAFQTHRATVMSEVILTRFAQNGDLKAFVRQVMMFDIVHPVQALARMQRTARVMTQCLPSRGSRTSWLSMVRLNLVYTFLVCVWLFDTTPGNRSTSSLTQRATTAFRL